MSRYEEKNEPGVIDQVFLAAWISSYTLTFLLWLAAIWVGGWRMLVTGLLTLVLAVVLMCVWGFRWHNWGDY